MIWLVEGLRLIPLVLITFGLSGCSDSWSWHQKLTVTVQTPDGVVSGSSVMRGRMTERRGALVPAEANGVSFSLSGEAVVVKLPNGHYLFALLTGIPSASWLLYPRMPAKDAGTLLERAEANTSASLEVPRDQHPLLVTFDDIADPASVKKVDPSNFAATFGPGYRLTSITLSITEEPVTEGKVKKVLGWLAALGRERPTLIPKPPRLRKDATDPDIQYLTPGPFSTELYK